MSEKNTPKGAEQERAALVALVAKWRSCANTIVSGAYADELEAALAATSSAGASAGAGEAR